MKHITTTPTLADVLAILKAYFLAQATQAARTVIQAARTAFRAAAGLASRHAEGIGGAALILSLLCILWMSMEAQNIIDN